MKITIEEGRFTGVIEQDPKIKNGARWMWTIAECTFPGNKHADPDFETHTSSKRTRSAIPTIADCINKIRALIKESKRIHETELTYGCNNSYFDEDYYQ